MTHDSSEMEALIVDRLGYASRQCNIKKLEK